jgi:hypothetical protein
VGLTSWLLRHTPPRPLVVTAPGGTGARLAAERVARERGWPPALSPAAANMLVVAGATQEFEPYAARLWHAMPAPRARVDLTDDTDVPTALTTALATLHDAAAQRAQAEQPEPEHDHAAMSHDHMAGPDGIPMADRAPDRDGLKLDQLTLPLGPALPLWPPGLVIHTRLQGDVIQEARIESLGGQSPYWTRHPVAQHLDSCTRLLTLCGWPEAAAQAEHLRDEALSDTPELAPRQEWARRVRRSHPLRWLLTGIGRTTDAPAALAGDALDRLNHRLDAITLTHRHRVTAEETQWAVEALPGLLAGTELATARLVVASLDPDLDLGAQHG